MKRPMTMPQAILEFLDEDIRENAIRYLSNYLVEVSDSFGNLVGFFIDFGYIWFELELFSIRDGLLVIVVFKSSELFAFFCLLLL